VSTTDEAIKLPERREYLMTPEEFKEFKDACNPRIVLVGSDERLMKARAQQLAREFWKKLGERHGFDPRTTEPVEGKHYGYFTAVPLSPPQGVQ
jgi:hypothetical protein